jgi:electron transfer flavoprotein alpha subunit
VPAPAPAPELPSAVAVVVVNQARLPWGAAEAVAEAGGAAVVVGQDAEAAGAALAGATQVWWADGADGPGGWAARLAAVLDPVQLVVLPASPDGRDLAPRLAAALDRPLLAGAVRIEVVDGTVRAELLRADGRVAVPVECAGPAVVTLMPGVRSAPAPGSPPALAPLAGGAASPVATATPPDAEVLALIEPDPATMDLADATRVLGGGAGLVPRGASDSQARAVFELLAEVAARLGASMGATRVVTDAGWTGHQRQIGTTGVAIDPDLYVALGVSGATQHTGGLGAPRHVVSVNTDASCPMTAMADLGLVADAPGLLLALARRLDVEIPTELKEFDA